MKKKRMLAPILCGLLVLSLCGCEKLAEMFPRFRTTPKKKAVSAPIPIQGTIIAEVNGMPITLEQLEQEIEAYNLLTEMPEAKITTREQKIAYLNQELVIRYLFYQEAKTRNFHRKPKVQELIRNVQINLLATQFLQDEMDKLVPISSEIENFYNLNKEHFLQEEERRIREIVVDTEQEAKETLIELLKGTDFSSLARQRSRARSAYNGGDLGFKKMGERGADFIRFDKVAFAPSLETDQISNIFKDKGGYYIVKVEEIRGGQPRSLSEVWEEIKTNVLFLKQQQRLQELSSQLLKDAKVVIYEEKIE